ncbi:hypothetical protein [Thalassoglobus polymorphus]|nr:hypothetical protein [Thalassoglobus polymorphus]
MEVDPEYFKIIRELRKIFCYTVENFIDRWGEATWDHFQSEVENLNEKNVFGFSDLRKRSRQNVALKNEFIVIWDSLANILDGTSNFDENFAYSVDTELHPPDAEAVIYRCNFNIDSVPHFYIGRSRCSTLRIWGHIRKANQATYSPVGSPFQRLLGQSDQLKSSRDWHLSSYNTSPGKICLIFSSDQLLQCFSSIEKCRANVEIEREEYWINSTKARNRTLGGCNIR